MAIVSNGIGWLSRNSSKLWLAALISLIFYTICLNCSETIILTPKDFSKIKIRFDFPQVKDDSATSASVDPLPSTKGPGQKFDQELVSAVITEKLNKLRVLMQNISNTNLTDSNPSQFEIDQFDDSLMIEPFTVSVRKPDFDINITLDTIVMTGVSRFTIADIACNVKSKKVSALLRFDEIRLSMYYKVSGERFDLASSSEDDEHRTIETKPYTDKGKLSFAVHGWRTAFSGKVIEIVNRTNVGLAGFGMRSHYNYFESNAESFVQSGKNRHRIDIGKHVSNELMRKAVNSIDDKMEIVMLERLNIREMGTWASLTADFGHDQYRDADDDRDDGEDDGHLLMMESKTSQHARRSQQSSCKRRRKRQVPCEVGEELDEYVDSLFRFLKRLIRVMEPFNLPNATIELEEHNLQIFLHSGGATRAYTFERRRPAWVLCRNETTTLGLTVGVEELRVHYKYRVIQDWRLLFDGDLEAQIRRPKAQLQITQLNPPENEDEEVDDDDQPQVQQRIDRLKVWKPGHISVLIRGLGNLSSALSMIINQMLTDTSTLDPVIRMIETDGVVAANDMLRNVSIPIFSII